ncbi:MAG: glycosyltransferase family 4 protein [Alphaproteobacteria bacterium]|nr:glycosyltransferase family 4 protein [Alphaproteobacteria bacterium]
MRVAFYSPIAVPDALAASGVQRMGTLLESALRAAGCEVWRPALPRTYEGRGDAARQAELKAESEAAADALLNAAPAIDAWFSYHVYYKSPDWVGPRVARALRVPYLIAEGSHAPKRAGGPWALGHEGTTAALTAADRLLAMTAFDRFCLDQIAAGRVRDLKPFIEVRDFSPSASQPLVASHLPHQDGKGPSKTRIVTAATMRDERKRVSYSLLAAALRALTDVPIALSIAGDGPMRAEIERMFAGLDGVRFEGMVRAADMPAFLAGGDVFAWPGLGEAYGLVFLEAQAAGLPIAACRDHGVPDTVREGETALLSAPGDVSAYAANLRRLVEDGALRRTMGAAAHKFVTTERSVEAAGAMLASVFAELRR